MPPPNPSDDLDRLLAGSARRVEKPLRALAKVLALRLTGEAAPNVVPYEEALAKAIQGVLHEVAMKGAEATVAKARSLGLTLPAPPPSGALAPLPHLEAMRDLVTRKPILARTAAKVARAYDEGHVFALARSASVKITERIQHAILGALQVGMKPPTATALIEGLGDFDRAYAETVFRTNVATAYSNGLMEQARDPAVADVITGFRFSATHDSNVRPNHLAADGLVAATNDPVWTYLRPPLGYNCRCALQLVPAIDVGWKPIPPARIPPGAHPDEGFRPGP